jgi:hypothetical protein
MRFNILKAAFNDYVIIKTTKKVKQYRYTPWRRLGGEEI